MGEGELIRQVEPVRMRTQKVVHVVNCHAGGEVGDVIVGGLAPPPERGNRLSEYMATSLTAGLPRRTKRWLQDVLER